MKNYLFIGLTILIGTNLAALSGVAYNRMGEKTAQLTLTERELSLPYNNRVQKENSGMSLSIDWRTPSGNNETYYPYNSRSIEITKEELLALGFAQTDVKNNYRAESKELYWAFEFDGTLHKAEIVKAKEKYQTALLAYEDQPNDTHGRKKNEYNKNLEREKTTNSRLFFIEASADYESIAAKFADQKNIIIIKGLAKPYYNSSDKTHSLRLKHLSIRKILVPLEYAKALSHLKKPDRRDNKPPRYAVDISWGNRLEPWVTNISKTKE